MDVFFVISGFFITDLLLREHENDGRIDIVRFYRQRALRLAPALLVVLLATLAAVMWLYALIDSAPIMASARSNAFYSGNAKYARNAVDYFSVAENPLLLLCATADRPRPCRAVREGAGPCSPAAAARSRNAPTG